MRDDIERVPTLGLAPCRVMQLEHRFRRRPADGLECRIVLAAAQRRHGRLQSGERRAVLGRPRCAIAQQVGLGEHAILVASGDRGVTGMERRWALGGAHDPHVVRQLAIEQRRQRTVR